MRWFTRLRIRQLKKARGIRVQRWQFAAVREDQEHIAAEHKVAIKDYDRRISELEGKLK